MIKTFRNKALANLWRGGKSTIDVRMQKRILVRLDRLDAAQVVGQMNLPGFDFHALRGYDPIRYTVHVNGPWSITFLFEDGDAYDIDFEQYH